MNKKFNFNFFTEYIGLFLISCNFLQVYDEEQNQFLQHIVNKKKFFCNFTTQISPDSLLYFLFR